MVKKVYSKKTVNVCKQTPLHQPADRSHNAEHTYDGFF
jgi:hypothetical protein